jgi:hypothetical protein
MIYYRRRDCDFHQGRDNGIAAEKILISQNFKRVTTLVRNLNSLRPSHEITRDGL